MTTFVTQKRAIKQRINGAASRDDLDKLASSIEIDDLQKLLQDYVERQTSTEKMAKMYYATEPAVNSIGSDCMKYMLEFLDFQDLSRISSVNHKVEEWCEDIQDNGFDRMLYTHPAFDKYFEMKPLEVMYGRYKIGYMLQNKYDNNDLNTMSFNKLGRKALLLNEDRVIYEICEYFGFKTKLKATCHTPGDDGICTKDRPFRDCREGYDWEDWRDEPSWDFSYGRSVPHATATCDDCEYDIWPVVVIACPKEEWRQEFVSKMMSK